MSDENEKLPTDTLTSLTFQDKVQGDTNSTTTYAFADIEFEGKYTNLKTINYLDTNVDTSNVTSMESIFYNSQLTNVGDF